MAKVGGAWPAGVRLLLAVLGWALSIAFVLAAAVVGVLVGLSRIPRVQDGVHPEVVVQIVFYVAGGAITFALQAAAIVALLVVVAIGFFGRHDG